MVFARAAVPFTSGSVKVLTDGNGTVRGLTFDPAVDPALSPAIAGTGGTEKIGGKDPHVLDRLVSELERYFKGERFHWSFEPDLSQETPFYRAVYQRVMNIPYGETVSYGQVALDVGSPGGARAVGQAMGRNRFPLVVPCHRVIAGGGRIGGFSSGPDLKRFLLSLEGVHL